MSTSHYGDKDYWDERYTENVGSTFDWLETYDQLKELLSLFVEKNHKILNMGCGNGELHEDMYDDGFHDILNIDISGVVVEQMKARS
jgi:2-polyprenyl-3-methyl-5-hydroxy-6-metoxy-1,4-benzoquinol methylase